MTDLNDSNAQNENDPNGSNDLNSCSTNRGRPSFEKKDLLTADEFKTIVDGVMQKTPAQAR